MTHKFVVKLTDECKGYEQDVDYLERVYGAEPIKEHDEEIYNKAIDDYMNKLCNHCMQQTNECYQLECPFCTDGCGIVNIAGQLKKGKNNENN